jgi:hypothetical protein
MRPVFASLQALLHRPTGIDPFRRRPAGVIQKHGLLMCLDLLQLESCTLVNVLSFARRVCVFTHTWLQRQTAYYKYCASQNKAEPSTCRFFDDVIVHLMLLFL